MDIADVKMDPQFLKGLMLLMKKKYWDGFKRGGGGEKKKGKSLCEVQFWRSGIFILSYNS